MFKKTNLILLGGPGAGKGTVSAMMEEAAPFFHISTGDLLRAEVKAGTELGKEAKALMDSGKLVPDEIVAAMVKEALKKDEKQYGMLLDGYPRTVRQAMLLEEVLAELGRPLDAVVYFHADDDFLLRRLTSRIMCRRCNRIYNRFNMAPKEEGKCDDCGGEIYQRDDDSEASARNRLRIFHEQTQPLIDYYQKQGLLIQIPCGEREQVFAKLAKALN